MRNKVIKLESLLAVVLLISISMSFVMNKRHYEIVEKVSLVPLPGSDYKISENYKNLKSRDSEYL